jgi:uncharacterized protein (DUF2147 family)
MKKNLVFSIVLAFSTCFLYGQADQLVGIYLTGEKSSQVRIFKATDGKYYGKVEWIRDEPDKLDVNNPDENLQKNKVWGLIILKGFHYNEDKNRWEGGTIYDPDNGKTYDAFMWFDEDNINLYLKGYVLGMKFIGRETLWVREMELRKRLE